MDSDDERFKLSLELDQKKPPNRKKKSFWQKILEVLEKGLRREEGESRDPSDW